MADAKVVVMVLKVDLHCDRCYKKVKKVLCKFHQIRDQMYDEKQNLVIIKVVCCNPERLRDKICCKGCGVIKSIEIKPADPPPVKKPDPPPPVKKPDPPPPVKKPDPPPPVKKPDPPPPVKKPDPPPPVKKPDPPPPVKKPDPPPPVVVPNPPPVQPVAVNICVPVHGYPPAYPMGLCCRQCYRGQGGGPCLSEYGRPDPCCDGCASGRPIYDSYGGGGACYVAHCQYLNEENASGCSVM